MARNTLNNTVYPILNDNDVKCCEYRRTIASIRHNSSIRQRTDAIKKFTELAKSGEKKAWTRIYDVFKLYVWEELENYISPKALISAKLSHYHLKIYGINREIAFRCLNKGAFLGDEYAQGWLGLEYKGLYYGRTKPDVSIKWLRIAALNGCVASQYNLAVALLKNFYIDEVREEVSSLYHAIEAYRDTHSENTDRFREAAMSDIYSYIA
jgi:hypothetical protein